MTPRDDDEFDETADIDRDEPETDDVDDSEMQIEADVHCPYCGAEVSITLDPAGGEEQEYVEDCEVCCRPWQVRVNYNEDGSADVHLEESA